VRGRAEICCGRRVSWLLAVSCPKKKHEPEGASNDLDPHTEPSLTSRGGLLAGMDRMEFHSTSRRNGGDLLSGQADFVVLRPDRTATYGVRDDYQGFPAAIGSHIPDLATQELGQLRAWYSHNFVNSSLPANPLADQVFERFGYEHPIGWRGPVAVTMAENAAGDIPPLFFKVVQTVREIHEAGDTDRYAAQFVADVVHTASAADPGTAQKFEMTSTSTESDPNTDEGIRFRTRYLKRVANAAARLWARRRTEGVAPISRPGPGAAQPAESEQPMRYRQAAPLGANRDSRTMCGPERKHARSTCTEEASGGGGSGAGHWSSEQGHTL